MPLRGETAQPHFAVKRINVGTHVPPSKWGAKLVRQASVPADLSAMESQPEEEDGGAAASPQYAEAAGLVTSMSHDALAELPWTQRAGTSGSSRPWLSQTFSECVCVCVRAPAGHVQEH